MNNKMYILHVWSIAFMGILTLSSCGEQTKKNSGTATGQLFTLPTVPAMLQSQEDRAAYVVTHYWDNFDFSDTTMIGKADITEQAFVDYLNLFPHTSAEVMRKSIGSMLRKTVAGSQEMFTHFTELYEKYLYDPNSPLRQEEYYITVLHAIIANNQIDEIYKTRPRYQLELALKNRPGDIAADFEFTLKSGQRTKLSKISATYTILFFNNPDCHDCTRVKEVLSSLSDSNVKIVGIYPDEDIKLWQQTEYPPSWINGCTIKVRDELLYDLRAIPTLYLLNKEKQVILKDTSVEAIADWLDNLN